ncbi:MAG: hypothetical protein EOO73_33795 [Myxococcales bacterium]|nr:MAG: hypothetical protein EOO73_33795 [Myxococcales bacterium]
MEPVRNLLSFCLLCLAAAPGCTGYVQDAPGLSEPAPQVPETSQPDTAVVAAAAEPQVDGTGALASSVGIAEVAVYQGVKVSVARDGAAVPKRNADLVQGREALVRVFVAPRDGFVSRVLRARITLAEDGAAVRSFEQSLAVRGSSTEADPASTFNVELPKDAFGPSTRYAVELLEASTTALALGSSAGARFPEQGLAPVGARETGPVRVLLVPVRYETDGSGRLPDTSADQLAQMARRLYSMYPTTGVELSLRAQVATSRADLGDMLDQMRELRATDSPPSDLAYYGMVRQAETFGDYCQGTCTTGIAGFGSMSGTSGAGMGIGFPSAAVSTFVHELGHIYRRPHAPCGGASGADASYPYPNGALGSWGYDVQTRELFEPQSHVDFMTYCSPEWISDYSYQQLLERIVVVNRAAAFRVIGPTEPRRFRTLRVRGGSARWGLDFTAHRPPGDPAAVRALDSRGALIEEAEASYEQGAEGEMSYFVPAERSGWHAVQVPGAAPLAYAAASSNVPFSR